MYRVLIADDEPSVINSLKMSVDWKELGLEIAACASNGKDALDYIETETADIAVLDIRMPGISGLELCEYLKKKYENLQIIFISGYAEFSYAQRAINYGALGYCLKPLEYDQITKLLLKAVQNLEKLSRPTAGTELPDVLESGQRQEIERILGQMGYHADCYFVAVTVGEGRLSLGPGEGLTVELGRGHTGYLLNQVLSEQAIEKFLIQAQNQSVGYRKEAASLEHLAGMLDDCTVLAYQFFIEPECRVSCEFDGKRSEELLVQLTKQVEKKRWEEVCGQLSLIDEKYRRYFDIRSAMRLCNIIHTGSLFREETADYYIYSQKQMVAEYGTFSGMLQQLRREIQETAAGEDQQEAFSNTAFMKLMRYIGENYHSEISLTSAGAALHMNPNYVSQLFKKETGTTFVHYITQLRMEDAMRLLTTTRKSATEIVEEVGYNDYFYFIKTFKKMTGKTPSQYRDEN